MNHSKYMKANKVCRPRKDRKRIRVPTSKCHPPLNLEMHSNTAGMKSVLCFSVVIKIHKESAL